MTESIRVEAYCVICRSEYTLPRLLDCFHIFYSPCLEELIKAKSTFSCPLCRIISDVPKDGVDSFKIYPFYDLLKEDTEIRKKSSCQMCDDNVVYSTCKDCDQQMCRNCHEYHVKHKTFRNHETQKYENKEENKEMLIQKCNDHNKDYTCYCKSCNIPICEECKKKPHDSHKTQLIRDAANCTKSEIKLAIEGLKSKLPYIENFIDNAKAEEKKYSSHIRQTETEMKTAAANIKEMLCKSVDLFLAQNLAVLHSESYVDKKLMQTFIEEADRDKMSIVNLIKTSEDIDRFANDYTLLTIGSALCRQIGLCERTCFQSELKINTPLYQAGNISYSPIRDFIGSVQRKHVSVVNLKLQLPCLEMPRYSYLYNIERLATLQCKEKCCSIFAIGDDSVQVSQLTTVGLDECMFEQSYKGELRQMKYDGSFLWQTELITQYSDRFRIIDVQTENSYVMCENVMLIVNLTKCLTYTFKITDVKITKNEITCRLNNATFLVFNADTKIFSVLDNSFSKIERKFQLSPPMTDVSKPTDMMVTTAKFIVMSMTQKILVLDLEGELKFSYSSAESDFRWICSDRYDNIFVADYKKNRICLFTSDGHFVRDVLTSEHGISKPISITVDGRGNLWV